MADVSRRRFLGFLGAAASLPLLAIIPMPPLDTEPASSSPAAKPTLPVVPTGTISEYLGTNCPVGWLPCDGRSIPAHHHQKLQAVLGDTFGNNRVPDLRSGVAGRYASTNYMVKT